MCFRHIIIVMIVVWDDTCSFCAKWIRLIRALDRTHRLQILGSSDPAVLQRLRIRREDADREIQVVDGDRRAGGFDALIAIAHHLPATRLLATVMALPPVRALGRRAYRYVAERRHCSVKFG
jgi:predicted DCC family thiol-disulfide oxidoreductase YuxK